ncbi:MAG: hypothetical protein ACT4P2_09915 [Pseudomonadota bacterium]
MRRPIATILADPNPIERLAVILRLPTASLALALAAAACAPALPPGAIAAFDGVWEGRASLFTVSENCVRSTPYVMTVRNGVVSGEIRSPRDPEAISARFEAAIQSDGTIYSLARPGGQDVAIRGRFSGDRFEGMTRLKDCQSLLSLKRR